MPSPREGHQCPQLFFLLAPTSTPAMTAAEIENLLNLDCSAAESSVSSTASQQPQANSISEVQTEFVITKELNGTVYVVFKPS